MHALHFRLSPTVREFITLRARSTTRTLSCLYFVHASSYKIVQFLRERDYVTFWSLLSQIRVSVICLPVCLKRWFTLLRGLTFRQYFFTAVYLGHPLTSVQNFTEIAPGEPSVVGVKRKKGSNGGPIEDYIS